ncbi:MAG TPA: hypothetical protein VEV45_13850 [Streptosporangiaceae bacterium]|nr:hypothetical protein [Streptosporangiaceae bacterium]
MAVGTSARGMLRLWGHDKGTPVCRKCPECGGPIRDREAARLGFCDRCSDFTGMCGAGRRIVSPDVMRTSSWHMPCTRLGTAAWEVTITMDARRTVLCETHDAQMRSGRIPWVRLAIPVRA